MRFKSWLEGWSLSKKLFLLSFVLIILVYTLVAGVQYFFIARSIKSTVFKDIMQKRDLLINQIRTFDDIARFSAERLMNVFITMNPKGASAIRPDNEVCDRFTVLTGGSVATIFKREGDDFLRIATSLKKEDGTRAVGTTLDRNHPAYQGLLKGEVYIGKATLFGREYMTKYVPVKDETGRVVGVLFIGFDITQTLGNFKNYLANFKVGEKGWVTVYDLSKKDSVRVLVGSELPKEVIERMLKDKTGVLEYRTKEDMISIYGFYEGFQWLVVLNVPKSQVLGAISWIRNLALLVNILGAFLVGIGIYIVVQRFLDPLHVMVERLQYVAKGDFTTVGFGKGYRYRKDEAGVIARAIIQMEEFVRDLIGHIKRSGETVKHTVEFLGQHVNSINKKAETQTMQANQIAAAVEEMSSTIADVARNASNAQDLANEMRRVSYEGLEIADGSVKGIDETSRSVEELKEMIDKLNRRIEEIGGVVSFIKDVADQTNLLALNATIEAARAGEHGKGFAVVADEVRKLAERTIKATQEIEKTIVDIQNDSRQTVKNMDITFEKVRETVNSIESIKEALDRIVRSSDAVKDAITQIAAAAEEQSVASNEVAQAAIRSTEMAHEIKRLNDELVKEMENLRQVVRELADSIKDVKI